MNARIDFDAVLVHRHVREMQCADAREEAIDQAKAAIRIELLTTFQRAFSGQPVVIPFVTVRGNVIPQDLSQALGDVWGDEKVDSLFLAMQSAPLDELPVSRAKFQAAAALAYIAGQLDGLAEHRVMNPELYA